MNTYAFISQTELREALGKQGMKTTSQTLRDWERFGIILPPDRRNRIMGRDAYYCEFALAECFAVHHLIKGDLSPAPDIPVLLPKFTLKQVAAAAKYWRKKDDYLIEGFPAPPTVSCGLALPPSKADKIIKLHPLQLPRGILEKNNIKGWTGTVANDLMNLSVSAWIWAVSIGCELFLQKYREK